jgi:hypothetical protein
LTDEQDSILFVKRDDGDRPRMAANLASSPRSVGPLDRVDAERQVVALVEDLRLDDPLFERIVRVV